MNWSLATYQHNGTVGVAVLREDGTLVAPMDLRRWGTMLDLVSDWKLADGVLRSLEIDDAPVIHYDALLAPLRWPRKVVCAGVNYRSHMREMGGEIPTQGWRPFFFLKPPTTTPSAPRRRPATTGRLSSPSSSASAGGTYRPRTRSPTWPATAWPTT